MLRIQLENSLIKVENELEFLKQRYIKTANAGMSYGIVIHEIEKIINIAPIILPDDYIEFLKNVSGVGNWGIVFSVDETGNMIYIWDAKMALQKYEQFFRYSTKEFLECAWLIGDDVGDLVYFYGEGNDGKGLYRTSSGELSFTYAEKIADSLTEFLTEGKGIDIATTL